MKVLTSCVFVALAAAASSAPTDQTLNRLDFLRDKRSQYGVHYVSPCAAASAPIPAFGPPYHYDVAPHGGYIVPHYYGGPHYRSLDPMETEHELLGFSDMNHMEEHMPMARYGYAPAHGAGPTVMPAPMATPPALGVFPNAHSGGCNVPLLFSCSPSIVQGRIVNTQHGYGIPADSYRGVIDHHAEVQEDNQDTTFHDSTAHEPSHISLHKS